MVTRFTPFSPAVNPHFMGGPAKKKPAPISTEALRTEESADLAADEYIKRRDAALETGKKDGATQEELEDAIRKSGSGKVSGSLANEIKQRNIENPTSETRFFMKMVDAYIPTLEAQAKDKSHPDHEYAVDFLKRYDRKKTPSTTAPSASTSGLTLEPSVYQADSGSPTKKA